MPFSKRQNYLSRGAESLVPSSAINIKKIFNNEKFECDVEKAGHKSNVILI